ncbi:MAG TPA: NAD-dependent epimerase/dehydratase family protein [Thermodesulfobacteriota bacterium]|nr:NAD-dependent epimerase/dehydratase family protein [Thermodesulfobacteriota bacterium]
MKAVITGGTGFIGGRLVADLIARGHRVRCLVRRTSKIEGLKKMGVELCYGDLSNPDSFNELTGGGDVVYHLAAMVSDWGPREEFYKINVEGTRNLLIASKESGVKRFVYMSTAGVLWKYDFWGVRDMIDIDESYPYPESYNNHYNESKAEAERAVMGFFRDTGLEAVIIRPSGVWGAGDMVILPRLVKAAKKGILLSVGRGNSLVSPCHVENLVRALILASASENAAGKIYFVNDGMKIEHLAFISRLLKAVGIDWSPRLSIPYSIAYGLASFLELCARISGSKRPPVLTRFAVAALAGSRTYSIERARRDMGYEPVIGLEEGLRQLGEWVKSIGGVEVFLRD